jgi:hypothetical protein
MSTNRLKVLLVSLLAVFAISAIASATASAGPTCTPNLGGPFKCEWKVGAPSKLPEKVTGAGGAFELNAGGKAVNCEKVTSKGTVEAGGADEAESITFTGCTANVKKCWAFSPGAAEGTIIVEDVDTQLVERENKTTKKLVLADEFKEGEHENAKKEIIKEFVTLEFEEVTEEGEDSKPCPNFPTTKVTGQVAAEVVNATESLEFPSPELTGNTLKAFGVAAKLTGKTKQKTEKGGTLVGE